MRIFSFALTLIDDDNGKEREIKKKKQNFEKKKS